ncbi:MAG: Gfo/Idh/MocA family oxidoreductase [Armatimonadetes bacterium]|nr:Gfo/Idh/MocA family oxidoreductase [Armatimonadota bacterium]
MQRREFLKAAAAAGATALGSKLAMASGGPDPAGPAGEAQAKQKRSTMIDATAKKMDKVRVGFIGVGARGSGHVEQMLLIDGVEVTAICDDWKDLADRSAAACVKAGRAKPAVYKDGPLAYKKLLDRSDVDIVIIATPWDWHTRMAVDAMERGKHAFIEVPAAVTIDECWKLVDTSEKTRKLCMMMENVCYGREELMVLNMCRLGVFGELLHGEGAYIHDLRGQMHEVEHGTGSWRTVQYQKRNGNLYPTHGLGPVAQYMGVNRGDRFDFLSSVSSPSRVRSIYAKKNFPPDHKWNKTPFVCGDINTSLIKTVLGRSIMVQWDEQLPRPYNRLNLIQGTKGVWGGFPDRVVVEGMSKSTDSWEEDDKLKPYYEKFDHPLWKRIASDPSNKGGHGGMDFIMLWRIVYCLRNGLPLDQDVYDAAAWSAISPLSEASVKNRGKSLDFPDFTRGGWKLRKPLPAVS